MKPLNTSKLRQRSSEKTVKTVPQLLAAPNTGLKPGVNERAASLDFGGKAR
jgi:hypothetical protein